MIIIPLTSKAIAPLVYLFSGIQKIVSGVLTYFAVSQYYYRLIGFLSSWISTLGASSVLVFSLVMSKLPLLTTINIGFTNRWMARHLSAQTIVFTRDSQISVIIHGNHTFMDCFKHPWRLNIRIRPPQVITDSIRWRWYRLCVPFPSSLYLANRLM